MFNCPLLLGLYKKGIGKNLLSNINFSQDVIVWEWRTKLNVWAKFKTSCLKCHIFPKELFEWRLVKDANVGFKKMPNRSFWPKQHHVATAFSMGFVFTKAQYHSLKRKRSSHHIRQLPNLWRYLGEKGRSRKQRWSGQVLFCGAGEEGPVGPAGRRRKRCTVPRRLG